MCAKSLQSCPALCNLMDRSPPGSSAHRILQALLPIGFSRQEYWSELPFPSPGDLSDTGIEPASLTSPALKGRFYTTGAAGKT